VKINSGGAFFLGIAVGVAVAAIGPGAHPVKADAARVVYTTEVTDPGTAVSSVPGTVVGFSCFNSDAISSGSVVTMMHPHCYIAYTK
jgi:hypothetical protein